MNYVGWRLITGDGALKQRAFDEMFSKACETFHLCDTVGCGCLVPGAPKVCSEVSANGGPGMGVTWNSGPNWLMAVLELRDSIKVEVYFDLQVLGRESEAFHRYLLTYGVPLFQETRRRA